MFPGNRRYTPYINPIPELDCDCDCYSDIDIDKAISNIAECCRRIDDALAPCDFPGCAFCRQRNTPFGNTLQGPSTRGGSLFPQGPASRGGNLISQGPATRASSLLPHGPGTRGRSVFSQSRATRGGSHLPSRVDSRTRGRSGAESRHSGFRGATARDWSRADEGSYARSGGGETRKGPMETGRRRG